MTKGFDTKAAQHNPIAEAAALLHREASRAKKPLVIPMCPEINDVGLVPGQLKPGQTQISPTADEIVIAVRCSASDTQELVDLVMGWQRKKLEGDRP